ncbi:MAG: hypothetical protein JWP03_2646 [Phycisphaerales bacterium]|nr:hypothetical protein [Phycisphaerales bacterium]
MEPRPLLRVIRQVNNATVIILGVVVLILILIPVTIVAYLVVGVAKGVRKDRARKAQRVFRVLPGLGEFSTTDGDLWTGEVEGVTVTLKSPEGPPDEGFVAFVRTLLESLPIFAGRVQDFLHAQEDLKDWADDAHEFEVFGMDFSSGEASFVLGFVHPKDTDGVYRVLCDGGVLKYLGRDD